MEEGEKEKEEEMGEKEEEKERKEKNEKREGRRRIKEGYWPRKGTQKEE